jgi:2-keto-4-pentenoate hydratase/2-oxohepta-3-ene-1,7-dioic acid hydratase in catechol pathway
MQFSDGQWTRGKCLDTFCPTGPWITTADEIEDIQSLDIRCRVNGVTLQDSSTSQMVFGVAELIAYVSRFMTLEPGDVILTGTPPGVGFGRTPPLYLKDGDVLETQIEALGELTNTVVTSSSAPDANGQGRHEQVRHAAR